MALTHRQQEVLDFIRRTELARGVSPTTREVQQHFGFRSQTAAVDHINALERKGALDKKPGWSRTVTTSPPRLEIIHVPIFGTVPAGIPELIEQRPDGFVAVDRLALGVSKDARLFATHVRGDSMINAKILDGDLAVLHADCEPRPGKIVAALIDGESTLKRLVQRRGKRFFTGGEPPLPGPDPSPGASDPGGAGPSPAHLRWLRRDRRIRINLILFNLNSIEQSAMGGACRLRQRSSS